MVSARPFFGHGAPDFVAAGLRMLAIAGLSVALAGCFGKKIDPDEYVEADPPNLMYNEGLALINAGDTKKASEKFKELDSTHPYSEYARKSLIMSAFLNFRRGNYDESISEAQRYIQLFPSSEDAAYAYYLIGESWFRRIPDVTRDQTEAIKAIEAMREVVRKFPDSEYAEDAQQKINIALDQIAGKEMQIGRYYQERHEYLASINRFKRVVQSWQRTRHVEEALHRLVECYMALGVFPEAQTAAAVLGHNFPDSPWYQDSYKLLQGGGLEPNENRKSWISRAFRGDADA